MAEVVDWSPVDDDNDSAPPVGAPEGMMPSAVNNTLRAMMGSLRRMYDKLVDGTQALPYLPSAGGVVSGNVAINGTGGLALGSTQLRNISSGLEVYNAAGGAISSRGPSAGLFFGDRDQTSATWTWLANGGVAYLYHGVAGGVLSVNSAGHLLAASLEAAGNIYAGTIYASGDTYAAGYFSDGIRVLDSSAGNTLIHKSGGGWGIQLQVSQSIYDNNSHVFRNASSVNTLTIDPAGNLVAGGNITAATGSFIGNACSIANGLFADLDASDIDCAGNIDAVTYTKSGVPVFALTEAEFAALETRIVNLETQLTQLRERSHV